MNHSNFFDSTGKRPDNKTSFVALLDLILSPFRDVFLRANTFIERYIPESLNPLANTGAIANVTFIIAVITGSLLLFWYAPSVHVAHESVARMMEEQSWYAGIIRSLHRYSSDACVLAVIFHILEIVSLKKFNRPRWQEWITGLLLFVCIWFEGWIGYWLVWDEGARFIASGTSKLMDLLPVFAEPLSRSFLTEGSINSLFFFVVFFGHMLLPLFLAGLLWIHITRLSRPRFLTGQPLTLYIIATLIFISIIKPATYGAPADLQALDTKFPIDYFFSLPIYVTNRLSAPLIWFLFLFFAVAVTLVPFMQRKRAGTATSVIEDKCQGCNACYNDCPFNSIQMINVGQDVKGREILKAHIDKDKCHQCGVCVGSCLSDAISYPLLPKDEIEVKIRKWLSEPDVAARTEVVFVCKSSFGNKLDINEVTGGCEQLPGSKVIRVPCVAWVNVRLIEFVSSFGVKGIHIVGCGSGIPSSRFGKQWTKDRLSGERVPKLRPEKVKGKELYYHEYNSFQLNEFIQNVQNPDKIKSATQPSKIKRMVAGLFIVAVASAMTLLPSDISFSSHSGPNGLLIISFKHAGLFKEVKGDQANIKNDTKLKHMRRKKSARRSREDVQLIVMLDGKKIVDKQFSPSGFFGDGLSIGTENLEVVAGPHDLEITIKESRGDKGKVFTEKRTIEVSNRRSAVVLFDKGGGFIWH